MLGGNHRDPGTAVNNGVRARGQMSFSVESAAHTPDPAPDRARIIRCPSRADGSFRSHAASSFASRAKRSRTSRADDSLTPRVTSPGVCIGDGVDARPPEDERRDCQQRRARWTPRARGMRLGFPNVRTVFARIAKCGGRLYDSRIAARVFAAAVGLKRTRGQNEDRTSCSRCRALPAFRSAWSSSGGAAATGRRCGRVSASTNPTSTPQGGRRPPEN